jgi:hypothetical protein
MAHFTVPQMRRYKLICCRIEPIRGSPAAQPHKPEGLSPAQFSYFIFNIFFIFVNR